MNCSSHSMIVALIYSFFSCIHIHLICIKKGKKNISPGGIRYYFCKFKWGNTSGWLGAYRRDVSGGSSSVTCTCKHPCYRPRGVNGRGGPRGVDRFTSVGTGHSSRQLQQFPLNFCARKLAGNRSMLEESGAQGFAATVGMQWRRFWGLRPPTAGAKAPRQETFRRSNKHHIARPRCKRRVMDFHTFFFILVN